MTKRKLSHLRVLVTGAAGFLGRCLVAELSSYGCEVVALVHKRGLTEDLVMQVARVVEGDITDADTWREAASEVDAICHFAAYIPPHYEDSSYAEACLQVNSLATLELAQIALRRPNCRFIYASAGNAYGFTNQVATEESLIYPADRATYYLASKLVGELYVENLRRTAGLESICFRISTPYGFGMAQESAVAQFMKRAHEGLPLQVVDGGIPTYDFVHVINVVQLVAAALRDGQPGVYNVGSSTGHSVLELAQAVADTYPERKVSIEVKPALDSIPASFGALSIDKAVKMWGYRPLSLLEGLADFRKRMEEGLNDHSDSE
jgi:UDP-glucose 4-epimerase